MIRRGHPDRPVRRREYHRGFDLDLVLGLRVHRLPYAHCADRPRSVRRHEGSTHQLRLLEFIRVVLLRDLSCGVRNRQARKISRIRTGQVMVRILMAERTPVTVDHRLRDRGLKREKCGHADAGNRQPRTMESHLTSLHGCGAHFEPSGSRWNSELMKNGVFKYSGSTTSVVSVKQSLPVGS